MAWNGSNVDGASASPKKVAKATGQSVSLVHGVLALIAVVAIGGGAYFCLSTSKPKSADRDEAPTESRSIAEVVPEIAPVVEPEPPKPEPKKIDPAKAARAAKLKAMTPAERLEFLFEEAKNKPIDFNNVSTNRPFATGTEQVMSWIFNARVGDMPPPMPKLSIRDEAHMAEILLANNPALEGDSEKVKAAKEMVELAKEECIKFVKEGGDVTEFLEYYRGQLVQAHQEWQVAQKSVMQVIREEPELAADFINEVNTRLGEKGIKPVNIPPRLREELGLD